MSEPIKLSEEDREKLVKLYETAQTTPVIALFATLAWNDVRAFMQELGKKYGFNPKKVGISGATGAVIPRALMEKKKHE